MLSLLGLFGGVPIVGQLVGLVFRLVNFILSCKPCMIALAMLAIYVYADVRATRREVAKCKAADIAMQLRAKERDLSIAEDARKFAEGQLKNLEAAKAASDAEVTRYEGMLKSGKVGRCALSPDAVERLRSILGR